MTSPTTSNELPGDGYPPLPKADDFMYQHEDTGITGFIDGQQVEWGFFKNNPRLQMVRGIYSESQMRAYVDADRALRAQAAPSAAAGEPPDDLKLTLLMAPYHLNLVVGHDRVQLLAFGRDVWAAAKRGDSPTVKTRSIADANAAHAVGADGKEVQHGTATSSAAGTTAAPVNPEGRDSVTNAPAAAPVVQQGEAAPNFLQRWTAVINEANPRERDDVAPEAPAADSGAVALREAAQEAVKWLNSWFRNHDGNAIADKLSAALNSGAKGGAS